MPKIPDRQALVKRLLNPTHETYIGLSLKEPQAISAIEGEGASAAPEMRAIEGEGASAAELENCEEELSRFASQNVFYAILGALSTPQNDPTAVKSAIGLVKHLCTNYKKYVKEKLHYLPLDQFATKDNPVLIAFLQNFFANTLSQDEIDEYKDPSTSPFRNLIVVGTVFGAIENVKTLIDLGVIHHKAPQLSLIKVAAAQATKDNTALFTLIRKIEDFGVDHTGMDDKVFIAQIKKKYLLTEFKKSTSDRGGSQIVLRMVSDPKKYLEDVQKQMVAFVKRQEVAYDKYTFSSAEAIFNILSPLLQEKDVPHNLVEQSVLKGVKSLIKTLGNYPPDLTHKIYTESAMQGDISITQHQAMTILTLLVNILVEFVCRSSEALGSTILSYYEWFDTETVRDISDILYELYQDDPNPESILRIMRALDKYHPDNKGDDTSLEQLAKQYFIAASKLPSRKYPKDIERFYKKSAELGYQKGIIEYILNANTIEVQKAKLATFELPMMVQQVIALFISIQESDFAFQTLLRQCDPVFSDPTQTPEIDFGHGSIKAIIASIRTIKALLDKNPSLAKTICTEVISESRHINKVHESLASLLRYGYQEHAKMLLDQIIAEQPRIKEDFIVKCFTLRLTKYKVGDQMYEEALKNIARGNPDIYDPSMLAYAKGCKEMAVMNGILSLLENGNIDLASKVVEYVNHLDKEDLEHLIAHIKNANSHAAKSPTNQSVIHHTDQTTVSEIAQPIIVQRKSISLPDNPQEFLHFINELWDSGAQPEPELVKLYFAVKTLLHEQSLTHRATHTKDRSELLSTWYKGEEKYESTDRDVYPILNKPGFYVVIDRSLRADVELQDATSRHLANTNEVYGLKKNGVKFFENIIEYKIPGDSRLYTTQIHLDTKTGNYIIILDRAGNHNAIENAVKHGHGPQIVSIYDGEQMLSGAKAAAEEQTHVELNDYISSDAAFHSIAYEILGADNVNWVSEYAH